MKNQFSVAEQSFCKSSIELGMKIAIWAGGSTPSPDAIREKFPMSRPTAYRYHDFLRSAKGLPPLSNSPEFRRKSQAA